MPIYSKISDTWREQNDIYSLIDGTWRKNEEVYIKDNDVWKSVWVNDEFKPSLMTPASSQEITSNLVNSENNVYCTSANTTIRNRIFQLNNNLECEKAYRFVADSSTRDYDILNSDNCFIKDNNDNFYTIGKDAGGLVIGKFDKDLNYLNSRFLSDGSYPAWIARHIAIDSLGNVYVTSTQAEPDGYTETGRLYKFDSSLDLINVKYVREQNVRNTLEHVVIDNTDNVFWIGYSYRKLKIYKFDSSLNELNYHLLEQEVSVGKCLYHNNYLYIGGEINNVRNLFILKIDPNDLSIVNYVGFGTAINDVFGGMNFDNSGNLYVGASLDYGDKPILIKFNENLERLSHVFLDTFSQARLGYIYFDTFNNIYFSQVQSSFICSIDANDDLSSLIGRTFDNHPDFEWKNYYIDNQNASFTTVDNTTTFSVDDQSIISNYSINFNRYEMNPFDVNISRY